MNNSMKLMMDSGFPSSISHTCLQISIKWIKEISFWLQRKAKCSFGSRKVESKQSFCSKDFLKKPVDEFYKNYTERIPVGYINKEINRHLSVVLEYKNL